MVFDMPAKEVTFLLAEATVPIEPAPAKGDDPDTEGQ
jgi:hypothetical protein